MTANRPTGITEIEWNPRYRRLQKGEIIRDGDEFDYLHDGKPSHNEPFYWVKVRPERVGKPVSDPKFPAHVPIRRLIADNGPATNAAKDEGGGDTNWDGPRECDDSVTGCGDK